MSRSVRVDTLPLYLMFLLAAAAYLVLCIGLTVKAFPLFFVVLYVNHVEFAVFKFSGFCE